MTRLDRGLAAADERLRGWLLGRVSRGTGAALAGLSALAFLALMMTRTLTQLAGAGMMLRLAGCAALALPMLVMTVSAMRIARKREDSVLAALLACALCGAAMLARVSFIERSSGDYDIYLAGWLDQLAGASFAQSMRGDVGEYNVLYQYILFLITRLPVPPLYAVKAVSFIGDGLLAAAMAALCAKEERPSMAAFAAALLLPSAVLNGGMFAQCDSLYAGCALWGLAYAMGGKPGRSAACFALSLAFKLQAVFLLPVVALLWAGRKLRLKDAAIFLAVLLAVMTPAILGGKSPARIIGIYASQTGIYHGLNYNAAGFYGLMETAGLDVYAYGNFSMALALGACAALLACAMRGAREMDADRTVRFCFLMVTAVVFLLPRMHERYFYLADMLAVALCCRDRRYVPAAGLMALASLSTCWETALPLWAASLMVFSAWMYAAAAWNPSPDGGKA